MKWLENNDNTIAGNIRHAAKIQEKLRIAQRMIKRHEYSREIAYVVEMPLVIIEEFEENPEKLDKLIEIVGEKAREISPEDDIVQVLEDVFLKNDKTIKIGEKIEAMVQNVSKEAQREAKLRAAYRIIISDVYICLDNVEEITGLEEKEVECLLEIARIRNEERQRTSKEIAKRLLQEQLKPERIHQLTDISLDEVLELQEQYTSSFDEDEELYDFDYSFLK